MINLLGLTVWGGGCSPVSDKTQLKTCVGANRGLTPFGGGSFTECSAAQKFMTTERKAWFLGDNYIKYAHEV